MRCVYLKITIHTGSDTSSCAVYRPRESTFTTPVCGVTFLGFYSQMIYIVRNDTSSRLL